MTVTQKDILATTYQPKQLLQNHIYSPNMSHIQVILSNGYKITLLQKILYMYVMLCFLIA